MWRFLWCVCLAQALVIPVERSEQVYRVVVQGCSYTLPWISPVLPLTRQCRVTLPRCGTGDRLSFVVESLENNEQLWLVEWSNGTDVVSFSAQRVDDGLWLELDHRVFVMNAVPSATFVEVQLNFEADRVTVLHSLDPFGPLSVPINLSHLIQTHPRVTCRLGPMPSVALHSFEYPDSEPVRGHQLLQFVQDSSQCVLEGRELEFQSQRWNLTRNSTLALLKLEDRDLVRCLPSGSALNRQKGVYTLELQDRFYRTLSSHQVSL